jgi:hypothetical protein
MIQIYKHFISYDFKIMNRLVFLTLLFSLNSFIYGQNKIISGIVLDKENNPLIGVTICPEKQINCILTDSAGNFNISINAKTTEEITVSSIGYLNQRVKISDSLQHPLIIHLAYSSDIDFVPYKTKLNAVVLSSSFERIHGNFNNYTELKTAYKEMFNQTEYLLMIKFSVFYHNYYGEIGFGSSIYPFPKTIDSLRTMTKLSRINLAFGYSFPSKYSRLVFTPYFSIDYLHFKLQTSSVDENIPLSQYFNNKYYDVNFEQFIGTLAGDLDLKLFTIHDKYISQSFYLSFGAGYYFKFSKNPMVYSSGNNLTTNGYISFDNLFLKAGIKFYLQE